MKTAAQNEVKEKPFDQSKKRRPSRNSRINYKQLSNSGLKTNVSIITC